MDAERRRQAEELFHDLVEVPVQDRERILAERCSGDTDLRHEVESLLDHSDATFDPLEGPLAAARRGADEAVAAGNCETTATGVVPGMRLGQYEVTRRIGAGGMGEVYEARQDNPRRTVALKLLLGASLSPSLTKRFEYEAHALGRLQHPGIAQIFETGTIETESGRRPFLAMELVRGSSLTDYAGRNGLNHHQRLELIAGICDAVQHAHQQGVIHRDLKPANILVTESGNPKILDFGVSRMTDSDMQSTTLRTSVGQLIGTVAYMSPEQAAGDPTQLDTRSDVYSIGVLLYELLANRLPHPVGGKLVHEATRMIREDEPTPLRSVNKSLRGDVETIISKALSKEKERRYQSAGELAADIRRFIRDEPVSARPQSVTYQFRKFAKRNKAWVTAAAAVFLVAVTGFVVSTVMFLRAEQARRSEFQERLKAEREAKKAIAINTFLTDMLAEANPDLNPDGSAMTVRDALDAAASKIESAFANEPEINAAIRLTIGAAYRELGQYEDSASHLEAALSIRRSLGGSDPAAIAEALTELGPVLRRKGDFDRAEEIFREALSIQEEQFGPEHPNTAVALGNLGNLLQFRGRHDEAEEFLRRAVAITKTATPDDLLGLGIRLDNLARTLHSKGEFSEADALFREALDCKRRGYGGDHAQIAISLNNLASLYKQQHNTGEAVRLFRESFEMMKRVLGDRHPNVAIVQSNLADALTLNGDASSAVPLARAAVDLAAEQFGRSHWRFVDISMALAVALHHQGLYEEAQSVHQELLPIVTEIHGEDHGRMGDLKSEMAALAKDMGDLAGAETLARQSLAIHEAHLPQSHPRVLQDDSLLASILRKLGKHAEALAFINERLQALRSTPPDSPLHSACIFREAALARLAEGDRDGALEAARENFDIVESSLPSDHWLIADARSVLGACLHELGDDAESRNLLVSGAEGLERFWGPDHPRSREARERAEMLLRGTANVGKAGG